MCRGGGRVLIARECGRGVYLVLIARECRGGGRVRISGGGFPDVKESDCHLSQ